MILRAVNTIKAFSLLIFFFMILWIYAYLPEHVKFFIPGDIYSSIMLSKSSFFYIQLLSFSVINLFLYWYSYFLKIGSVKQIVSDKMDIKSTRLNYSIWFGGFHFAVNILLLGVLYFSGFQNINNHSSPDQYSIFLIAGSILTIISLSGLLHTYIARN